MKLDHVAIWTDRLEELKTYYVKYFQGVAGDKYHNPKKQYQSYFLEFGNGARLEIMNSPSIPAIKDTTGNMQHLGLIHVAFEVGSRLEVDDKASELLNDGFKILDGPRVTGDGYYEFTTLDPDNNMIEVTTKVE
jgi:lactoylglutathione lyase